MPDALHEGAVRDEVVGVRELPPGGGQERVRVAAEHGAEGRIDGQEAALGRHQAHADGRVVERQLEVLLRLGWGLRGVTSFVTRGGAVWAVHRLSAPEGVSLTAAAPDAVERRGATPW